MKEKLQRRLVENLVAMSKEIEKNTDEKSLEYLYQLFNLQLEIYLSIDKFEKPELLYRLLNPIVICAKRPSISSAECLDKKTGLSMADLNRSKSSRFRFSSARLKDLLIGVSKSIITSSLAIIMSSFIISPMVRASQAKEAISENKVKNNLKEQ